MLVDSWPVDVSESVVVLPHRRKLSALVSREGIAFSGLMGRMQEHR